MCAWTNTWFASNTDIEAERRIMKPLKFKTSTTLLMLIAAASGLAFTAPVRAEDTPFLVRLRAVDLLSANRDSTGLDLSINDKVIPEIDFTYFFTPQWSAELVLTYPQKQTIRSGGVEIGQLKHLPPTLTAQYHFTLMGAFVPYVGAGLNFNHVTGFSNLLSGSIPHAGTKGFVMEAGLEFKILRVRLAPELRYTHWGNPNIDLNPFNFGLKSSQNQTSVLIGLSF